MTRQFWLMVNVSGFCFLLGFTPGDASGFLLAMHLGITLPSAPGKIRRDVGGVIPYVRQETYLYSEVLFL